MKKITSLFLAVLMLMLSTFSVAYAENTDGVTFVVENVEVNINDEQEIMLPICVQNNPGFASTGFDILYDSSCLTFVSLDIVEDDIFNGAYVEANTLEEGKIQVAFISDSNLIFEGAFLELRFTVKEEAYGKDPSAVTLVLRDMSSEDYADVPVKTGDNNVISDSTVTVEKEEEVLLGDVTLDGKITAADALLIIRYTSNSVTLSDAQLKAADVTKDGAVRAADALLIIRKCGNLIDSF